MQKLCTDIKYSKFFLRKNMISVHLLHRGELSLRQINTQTNRAVLPRPSYPRRSRQ